MACNQHIRGELMRLAVQEGLELVLPPPKWCTDNGTMVAWAGHERQVAWGAVEESACQSKSGVYSLGPFIDLMCERGGRGAWGVLQILRI